MYPLAMTSPQYKRIVRKGTLPYTYIQTKLEFEDDFKCPEIGIVAFKTIILGALRTLYGEVGACISVDVLKYNPTTKDAILRIPASNTVQVWSSLTLHGQHAGLACAFRISQRGRFEGFYSMHYMNRSVTKLTDEAHLYAKDCQNKLNRNKFDRIIMPPPDPVYILRGSRAPVTSLTFANQSDQNDMLFSGDAAGVVYAWNMKVKRVVASSELHAGKPVLWIDQSDERDIFTQGRDGKVRKCYVSESNIRPADSSYLPSTLLTFCKCCFLKMNTSMMLAVPSEIESRIDVYDLKSSKRIMELVPPKSENKFGMCMSIASKHTDDGETNAILIGYEDGSVALWDIRNAKICDRIHLHDESLMCLTYSSKINVGISGSVNNQLHTWTINSDDKIRKLKTIETQISGVNQILMRSDNKLFIMAGWDGNVGVYGLKKMNLLAMLLCHNESVQTLAFSSENLLACGSKDHSISLWDIYR